MGVVLIIAIAIGVFIFRGRNEAEEAQVTTSVPETELQKDVMVDNIVITGLSREEAREKILEQYAWEMTVSWNEESIAVTNLMGGKVDELLTEIYQGEPKESYTLDTSGLEDAVASEVTAIAAQWDKAAKNGSISSFDAQTGKFVFSGAESGQKVNQEKLAEDILEALDNKDFDAVIAAEVATVEPEVTEAEARERYKTISTYTTKTTANSKRNTNVRLACEAIDGIVLQPGESFSFNDRVGERTAEKGYQSAAAYSNGEVVQEIGGGVCQVSTTLYNAVVRSGLKTTVRRSHTFEPSYVTPGMDATVSWGGPDYEFVNNSSFGIGIRASYSNQTCTVSIYGVPVLEDGVKYDLKSTKIKDIDPPAPTYVEDQTVQPGLEVVDSAGSMGSQWEVRLVITKNGETVSQDVDHTATYKGHAPVVKRNTSGVWVPAPGETLPGETLPDGQTLPGESSSDGVIPSVEPGSSSSAESSTAEPGASEPIGPGTVIPTAPSQPEPVSPGVTQPSEPGPGTVSPNPVTGTDGPGA